MHRFRLQRLDRYIAKKFLTTFFFMIAVFCVVAVVFDLMENVGRLLANQAPLGATILYYLSFCFHFGNLLSGFIVFLTIIITIIISQFFLTEDFASIFGKQIGHIWT